MGNKISLKTEKEIEILKEGGLILSEILQAIRKKLVPGTTGDELNEKVKEMAKKKGAFCSFNGFNGYPAHFCLSLNDEVVHGIPFGKVIREGDVVGVDMGIKYKGLFTDAAFTHFVPYVSKNEEKKRRKEIRNKKKLIDTTFLALKKTLDFCGAGFRVGDIGHAISSLATSQGFSVVKNLVGHGVGHAVHEDPMIPNFGEKGTGPRLNPGLVIAIEPMINVGEDEVYLNQSDNWTFKTKDSSLSAHFEWTVAITEQGPVIITPLEWI